MKPRSNTKNSRSTLGTIAWGCVLLLCALGAALFGTNLAYRSQLSAIDAPPEFQRISSDGWIQEGSTITFANLLQRGNQLELTFNPWRPPGMEPAQIQVSVCGAVASSLSIDKPGPFTVFLTGECQPRVIAFEVLNPFTPSESDTRKLGAQLVSVELTSRLGIPLADMRLVMLVAGALFLLSSLCLLLPFGALAGFLALLVPVVGFQLLSRSDYNAFIGLDTSKVFPLWLLFTALVAGLVIGRFTSDDDNGQRYKSRHVVRGSLAGPAQWFVLLIIFASGAYLRFYGLNFGLPANFHPDEVPKVNAIMRMVAQGDLDPKYFLHPSLLLYSSYLVNTIFHLFDGTTIGSWIVELAGGGASGAGVWRETAFLAGRTVSATAGSLSIILIFLVGRRLFSSFVGLMAAGILAVTPLHVACSRYMKEDALLVALILTTIAILLRAVQENRRWLVFLASFIAGCSAATKYSGLLSVVIVGAAPWLRSRSWRPDFEFMKVTILALPLAVLGFVICTPYSILTSEKFIKDFNSERNHMRRGHTTAVDAWSQLWTYHFSRSIKPGLTWFVGLLATLGCGILIYKRRIEGLFLVGLVLVFYLPAEYVKAKPAPQPERYILPCLPFLALAAAAALRSLWTTKLKVLVPIAAVLAIMLPGMRSIHLARELPNDTRLQAAQWMRENLPAGSRVMVDWKPYGPRFWKNEFEILYPMRSTILETLSVNRLKVAPADYLILSSLFFDRYFSEPNTPTALRGKFRDLFEQVPTLKTFSAEHGTYGFNNPTIMIFDLRAIAAGSEVTEPDEVSSIPEDQDEMEES